MSQQDLERGDQEVMGIVNDHAHPDTAAAAEKITEQLLQPEDRNDAYKGGLDHTWGEGTCKCGPDPKWYRKQKVHDGISTGICVAVCLLVAVLLVVAKFVPDIMIWIVNGGVLCCGIVVAVKLDRLIRRWRNRW